MWALRASCGVGIVAATIGSAVALLAPGEAAAVIHGPCSASIKGQSVAGLPLTAAHAIPVGRTSHVVVAMAAHRPMSHYSIVLIYQGLSFTIVDKAITSDSWTNSVPVSLYSKYGTGTYEVKGTSTGPNGLSCSGAALVDVQ